jgi:antitoxin component of RelBE/YafQ-DinJ toxin-antitoxin module
MITIKAICLFLKQLELHRGLPFSVSLPNAETVTAMSEANNPSVLKRYSSFRELRDQL